MQTRHNLSRVSLRAKQEVHQAARWAGRFMYANARQDIQGLSSYIAPERGFCSGGIPGQVSG
jgi:hypothetical protein